jgi:hypothetical protein
MSATEQRVERTLLGHEIKHTGTGRDAGKEAGKETYQSTHIDEKADNGGQSGVACQDIHGRKAFI